jgi:transcriptional regulator with XRE-family HTH domain
MMQQVAIHGHSMPLTVLARIVNNSVYTQRDLAEKIGCNQSMVSRYLRGQTAITPQALTVLEGLFTSDEIEAAMVGYKKIEQFPLDDMYELMKDVHSQSESNDINVVMGLRTLINLGEAWSVLGEAFSESSADQRFGAAFSLALAGRTYGDERNYLRETFYNRFGIELIDPVTLVDPASCLNGDGSVRHPCEVVVDKLLGKGMAVWGWGPTGCGKSEAGYNIAIRQGKNLHRVQGKREFLIEEAFGKDKIRIKDGSPYSDTLWGPVMKAAEEGGLLMIDEISAIPPGYLFDFHNVLDKKPIHWDEKVLPPRDGFAVYATDNTTGQAEDELYVGTTSMNEALRDRFLFVEFGFMEKKTMIKAVTHALKLRGVGLDGAPAVAVQAHNMEKAVERVQEKAEEFTKMSRNVIIGAPTFVGPPINATGE